MEQRFWVVGGNFSDFQFRTLEPGTEKMSGPFSDEVTARTEWQRLTFRDRCLATTRYTIAVEPQRP
jgi:hypothetical protein